MTSRKDMHSWLPSNQSDIERKLWAGMGCLLNLPGIYYNVKDWERIDYSQYLHGMNLDSIWRSVENDICTSFKKFGIDNNLFTKDKSRKEHERY